MMTKEEADKWIKEITTQGVFPAKQGDREPYPVGVITKDRWDDFVFALGVEYGIRLAVAKIYEE